MGVTKQRHLILKILSDGGTHMTADQILEKARLVFPNISKGTIYRNLNLMADDNAIKRVRIPGEPVFYDANIIPHQHTVCVKCGKIMDIAGMGPEAVQKLVGPSARIVDYSLVIYVMCEICLTWP